MGSWNDHEENKDRDGFKASLSFDQAQMHKNPKPENQEHKQWDYMSSFASKSKTKT